jgi:hypothetical protein
MEYSVEWTPRWRIPVNQHIEGVLTRSDSGITYLSGLLSLPLGSLEREHSKKDDYYQYYVQ